MKSTDTLYAVEVAAKEQKPYLAFGRDLTPALFLHKGKATDYKGTLEVHMRSPLRVVRVRVTMEWEGK